MFTKWLNKMAILIFLCVLLTNVSLATEDRKNLGDLRLSCSSPEKDLIILLGLREDVNDVEIVKLLDIPEKQIFAMALVRYRKIYSTTPKLLQIVNDDNTLLPAKIAASQALCGFGNKEWIPTIKALSLDPNGIIARTTLKIQVAGLLARAGDYSHFERVASAISDSREWVRGITISQLGDFGRKTDPVTDLAAELLLSVSTTDPVPRLREHAIYSLEKLSKKKPQIIPKLIDALETNKDSPDKYLGITSRVKLKIYGPKRNEE